MSPRAVKRRLAQHAEKSKASPMASTKTSQKNGATENIGMIPTTACGPNKSAAFERAQSKMQMVRVLKEMEQQSEMSMTTMPVKKRRTWKNFHRWVEQTPEEPLRKSMFCLFYSFLQSSSTNMWSPHIGKLTHCGYTKFRNTNDVAIFWQHQNYYQTHLRIFEISKPKKPLDPPLALFHCCKT
jgi:hypothetical protein